MICIVHKVHGVSVGAAVARHNQALEVRRIASSSTTAPIESKIAAFYNTKNGRTSLLGRIKLALLDVKKITLDDIKSIDGFHTGGVHYTNKMLQKLQDLHYLDEINKCKSTNKEILDIGCGIGGTVRNIASRCSLHSKTNITGIDLSGEYIATAKGLNELLDLPNKNKIKFLVGSALNLPIDDGSIDLALMLHVGMNVREKKKMFSELSRVLKPHTGITLIYDVVAGPMFPRNNAGLIYPLPWSDGPETSFVTASKDYIDAATSMGLQIEFIADHANYAKTSLGKAKQNNASKHNQQEENDVTDNEDNFLGMHLLMGDTMIQKVSNYRCLLLEDKVTTIEMVFRKT